MHGLHGYIGPSDDNSNPKIDSDDRCVDQFDDCFDDYSPND